MTKPQFWYPVARGMKRKLILHIGPTNSGKTHSAISVLSKAKSAVYCAPLRLLAGEVWEKLNTQYEVPCDLITGQQCIEIPGSTHVSCTIEMVNITKPVDVAIIDEYQLISDEKRGWAWTKALLGLPAKEIHLTGDTSRIELIKHLCSLTGDELEVREYQRLSPLAAESNSVKSLRSIKEGDAVIVFSRRQVYEVKREIEKVRKMKCCIVYGSLPPEARSEQAKLFNDQNSEFKILVGTDCIGLGLNLNIRRIVFASCQKFDGNVTRKLTPSEIRQIAGRAGRFKSIYPEGYVSSFDKNDLYLIKSAMEHQEPEDMSSHKAVVFPNFEQFAMFSDAMGGDTPFSEIIHAFVSRAKVAHYFSIACHLNMYDQACSIDHIPLDMEERYTFCLAPVDTRIHRILKNFIRFADDFCSKKSVPFRIYSRFNEAATTPDRLEQLEIDYKIAELYIWLANRFPDKFSDKPRADKYLEDVTQFINQTLSEDTTVKTKKKRTRSKRVD
uniref:RNA helicase n=1 Tax=Arcella intermedia TaxID=1963864 RepID=A0A6B2L2G2_9EUKA